MATDVVLETSGLGKRFGRRWAVRDLDLRVYRGDVFGFLGPNGAGKSTTIRMILSLIRPTAGAVRLFGRSLRAHRGEVLREVGGLVEAADFYLYLSARRNLEIIGSLRGGVGAEAIGSVLDLVGLAGRAEERVKTFSHGMKQRLGIAQALLGDPQFIVLDEPTTGLDPQGIKDVRELIVRLSRERGMTIFLSSHHLHEIEQTASSMAIINRGALVVQGKVQEILNQSEVRVRIECEQPGRAAGIVAGLSYARAVEREDRVVQVTLPGERLAEVNGLLVRMDVGVCAFVPKRSLEDYFLAITEGASDVAPDTHLSPRGGNS
jgi:ABC-type multidrug transport system ATPase subunit